MAFKLLLLNELDCIGRYLFKSQVHTENQNKKHVKEQKCNVEKEMPL